MNNLAPAAFPQSISSPTRRPLFMASLGWITALCGAFQESSSYRDKLWEGLHCGSVGDPTRAKETTRWLAVLSGLCLILLALVIWLATEVADNRHAISQLRSDVTQSLANDASVIASLNATSGSDPGPGRRIRGGTAGQTDCLLSLTLRCAQYLLGTGRARDLRAPSLGHERLGCCARLTSCQQQAALSAAMVVAIVPRMHYTG